MRETEDVDRNLNERLQEALEIERHFSSKTEAEQKRSFTKIARLAQSRRPELQPDRSTSEVAVDGEIVEVLHRVLGAERQLERLMCGPRVRRSGAQYAVFRKEIVDKFDLGKAIGKWRGECSVLSWLAGALAYHVKQAEGEKKKNKQRQQILEQELKSSSRSARPPSIDSSRLLDAQEVRNAIARLSPANREFIQLRYHEQLERAEIMKRLNMSEGSYGSRHREAKKALKQILIEIGYEL